LKKKGNYVILLHTWPKNNEHLNSVNILGNTKDIKKLLTGPFELELESSKQLREIKQQTEEVKQSMLNHIDSILET